MKVKLILVRWCLFLLLFMIISGTLLAQKTISGKVISNADSQPVAGATVSIRGTQAATQTATDGTFSIRSSQSDPVLVISSVGFSNVEV
ncbi:MAG TPA: carboxypeptidase-like regulatory domain-containing protein, partial [Segetibacter sp.]|nr:carboxypeptidase-like regulatory domain-containing protein [Segetibacter sp.]